MLTLLKNLFSFISSFFSRKKLAPEQLPQPTPEVTVVEASETTVPVETKTEVWKGLLPPHLIVDLYWQDCGPRPKWEVLLKDVRYKGAIIKATEGARYGHADWFVKNWPLLKTLAGDRYGKSWFRGAYHYLRFSTDGAKQADYYLKVIEQAGGWDSGDFLPVVDVELGQPTSTNHSATASKIVKCTEGFVNRVKEVTGREVILYGRGAMRDKGITSHMGCRWLWNPSYTKTMDRSAIERVGWRLSEVALWQYTDGEVNAVKQTTAGAELPHKIPGFGNVDCSVFLLGGLDSLKRALVG